MRTIIAGSRDATNYKDLLDALDKINWKPSVVLCGTARGADQLGNTYANNNDIPVEYYPANWNRDGRGAGYKRNEDMANKADALIAIWDGESKGTTHMINIAKEMDLVIYIHRIEK